MQVFSKSSRTPRVAYLVGAGAELIFYFADADECTLKRISSIGLPDDIHYAWQSADGAFVYVATTDGGPVLKGASHHLVALRIDWATGEMSIHGPQVELEARPIHTTIDATGRYLLTTTKPLLIIHAINEDGTIGDKVGTSGDIDLGAYPHQSRFSPTNRAVITVNRGYRARADRNRNAAPGGLDVLHFIDGRLSAKAVVAPDGGLAFGARNLDFHPTRPWVYVSLEVENQLLMFDFTDDILSEQPVFKKDTLRPTGLVPANQALGPIHVHPNGRYVYTANRSGNSEMLESPVWDVGAAFDDEANFIGGENSIAVYAINQDTGEPVLLQNADTFGLHARCFGLDPSGRMLVAGHIKGAHWKSGAKSGYVPLNLSVFRVGDDGKLTFVRAYELKTDEKVYWSGMVAGV